MFFPRPLLVAHTLQSATRYTGSPCGRGIVLPASQPCYPLCSHRIAIRSPVLPGAACPARFLSSSVSPFRFAPGSYQHLPPSKCATVYVSLRQLLRPASKRTIHI